jgi:hypothetical protein
MRPGGVWTVSDDAGRPMGSAALAEWWAAMGQSHVRFDLPAPTADGLELG